MNWDGLLASSHWVKRRDRRRPRGITLARKSVGLSRLTGRECQAGKPDLREFLPCRSNIEESGCHDGVEYRWGDRLSSYERIESDGSRGIDRGRDQTDRGAWTSRAWSCDDCWRWESESSRSPRPTAIHSGSRPAPGPRC